MARVLVVEEPPGASTHASVLTLVNSSIGVGILVRAAARVGDRAAVEGGGRGPRSHHSPSALSPASGLPLCLQMHRLGSGAGGDVGSGGD